MPRESHRAASACPIFVNVLHSHVLVYVAPEIKSNFAQVALQERFIGPAALNAGQYASRKVVVLLRHC